MLVYIKIFSILYFSRFHLVDFVKKLVKDSVDLDTLSSFLEPVHHIILIGSH